MKRTIFSLFGFLFISSLCFAQMPQAPAKQAAQAPAEIKNFMGKIDSVSLGDAMNGNKPEIVVINDNGQKISFRVKAGTPITAKDGKALAFSDLKKDNKVAVEYTVNNAGTYKAQSIILAE